MKRIGVIGIAIKGDNSIAIELQKILSQFSSIIVGRMGVPDKDRQLNVISLIVEGSIEEVSALTSKLGRLESVNVKSTLLALEVE